MLSLLFVLPLCGALLALATRKSRSDLAMKTGFLIALLPVALLVRTLVESRADQIVLATIRRPWIASLGVEFHCQLDVLATFFCLLSALGTLAVLAAAPSSPATKRRGFIAVVLIVECLYFVAFTARDLFLFYGIMELTALALFFAIALARGRDRIRSALSVVIFSSLGTLPMLVVLLHLRRRVGTADVVLDFDTVAQLDVTAKEQWLGLIAFGLAFGVRMALLPLHRWWIEVLRGVPRAVIALFAAGWFALGIYGFLRFALPFFPRAVDEARLIVFGLGLAALFLGGIHSLFAVRSRRLLVDVTVTWMGLALLGLGAANVDGLRGAALAALTHGLGLLGLQLADRARPLIAAVLFGVPGLAGFSAFVAIIAGVGARSRWAAAAAALGVLIAIVATWLRLRSGDLVDEDRPQRPAQSSAFVTFVIVTILLSALGLGLFPHWVSERIDGSLSVAVSEEDDA